MISVYLLLDSELAVSLFVVRLQNGIIWRHTTQALSATSNGCDAFGDSVQLLCFVLEETQALMGATRPASGIFQQPRPASEKCSCYLVELVSFLLIFPTRDASPPLEVAFGGSAQLLLLVLEETQALMGATRLASGIFQQPRPASEKCSCYLMELVSILFMFVVLTHFPGSGAASFFFVGMWKMSFYLPVPYFLLLWCPCR